MKTALLISASPETPRLLRDILGPNANFIVLPPPADQTRDRFEALYGNWSGMADALIVDAVSLEQAARWAIEAIPAVALPLPAAIVVRATEAQRSLYPMAADWLVVSDTDTVDQLRQSLGTFLELRDAQARLRQADELRPLPAAPVAPIRPAQAPDPRAGSIVSPYDSFRYREALKSLSGLLSQQTIVPELLEGFMRLIRELLSLGKVAIFMRGYQADLFGQRPGPEGQQLTIRVSTGIRPELVGHFRLALDGGIGGYLGGTGKILRRDQLTETFGPGQDQLAAREFGLLGTEVAVPMFDDDQLIGVITFSGKITNEPLAVEELELAYHLAAQLAQAIRHRRLLDQIASQQRFTSEVLGHFPSGVIVVAPEGKVLSLNRHARELLGLGTREAAGLNLRNLPSRVADVLFETLQSGREIYKREVTLLPANRPLGVSASRIALGPSAGADPASTGADSAHQVVIGLVEDLTQIKLQQTHAREQADREFFMRLASRLSHELRNSLVSIKIFAQLLPERFGEKEFREQFSTVVSNEVNRVDVLVNNLTFFAHPLELVGEQLPLGELIDSCLENVRQEFARKKLAVLLNAGEKAPGDTELPVVTAKKIYGPKIVQIEGDKIRLRQAIEHVLRNAVQAMATGGRLTVSTAEADPADYPDGKMPEGGAVRIEFQDSGEGISLDLLKRVTEPFVTTRNVGVGLGLTIARKIVERHSGRVEVDSTQGHGATVKILLPVKMQPHTEDALLSPIAPADPAIEPGGESPMGEKARAADAWKQPSAPGVEKGAPER